MDITFFFTLIYVYLYDIYIVMCITFFFTFHHDKLFQACAYLELSMPQPENSLSEKT